MAEDKKRIVKENVPILDCDKSAMEADWLHIVRQSREAKGKNRGKYGNVLGRSKKEGGLTEEEQKDLYNVNEDGTTIKGKKIEEA